MRCRKIFATLLLIAGVVCMGFSLYITQQVDAGQSKIESAEKSVKQGNQLFSLSPATKDLGQGITRSAQKKINSGKELVSHYAQMASNLKVAAIVLIVAGVGLFLFPRGKKR